MPYVITITREVERDYHEPGQGLRAGMFIETSRRAVATIEEAREGIREMFNLGPGDQWGHDRYLPGSGAADDLTESGGTVGPLPDGTTITVEHVDWMDFERPLVTGDLPDIETFDSDDYRASLIDAYNARQEARA